MTPYRAKFAPVKVPEAPIHRFDQLAAPLLIFAVGFLRCSIAVATGETWGVEASVALLMVLLGGWLSILDHRARGRSTGLLPFDPRL